MHRSSVDLDSLQPRDTKSSSCEEHDDTFHHDRRRLGINVANDVSFYGGVRATQGRNSETMVRKIDRIGSTLIRCNFNATFQRHIYGVHICGNVIASFAKSPIATFDIPCYIVDCIVAAFENVVLVYIYLVSMQTGCS